MTAKGNITTVTFELERETPGALRYQEVDSAGIPVKKDEQGMKVGTLYLRKRAMGGQIPQRLTISVQAE